MYRPEPTQIISSFRHFGFDSEPNFRMLIPYTIWTSDELQVLAQKLRSIMPMIVFDFAVL